MRVAVPTEETGELRVGCYEVAEASSPSYGLRTRWIAEDPDDVALRVTS